MTLTEHPGTNDIDCTTPKKLQWNSNKNMHIFIQEHTLEIVIILYHSQWVRPVINSAHLFTILKWCIDILSWTRNTDVPPGKSGSLMWLASLSTNGLPRVHDRKSSVLPLSWLHGVVGHELDRGSSILSLTVAMEDRAPSPYLNCVGWQDKSSFWWSFWGVLPLS